MRICQNSQVVISLRAAAPRGVWGIADEALAGVGGADGMKNDGIAATLDCVSWSVICWKRCFEESYNISLTMIEMYRTIFGISEGLVAHSESINWPRAAPRGFARLATAVALVRP